RLWWPEPYPLEPSAPADPAPYFAFRVPSHPGAAAERGPSASVLLILFHNPRFGGPGKRLPGRTLTLAVLKRACPPRRRAARSFSCAPIAFSLQARYPPPARRSRIEVWHDPP